ncbi:ABC transporter permease [Pseudonocardia nigra]|uniref:ABC transporter permease n=1 Tax=Pseudonocardia nigra TaxID=1921578 RepID=UPI001C5F8647|nr:ABC transporter permease [Pseudonocardia nigra]
MAETMLTRSPDPAAAPGARRTRSWAGFARQYGAAVMLVLLFAYNALFTPNFLSLQTLLDVQLRQAAPVAIVALGMALVIAVAGIDLSVGSVMAIAGQVGALSLLAGAGPMLAILLALVVAAVCGAFNGTLVVRYGVQPIIATLILFIAGRGIAQLLSGGRLTGFRNPDFQFLGLGRIAGVPMPVVLMVLLAAVLWFVVRYTAYGRTLLATGGNENAARLAGVRTGRVKMGAYVASAALAGLVGLVVIGITSASDANNVGLGVELDAIAAVAVSGTPLTGGRISIIGTLVGAVMLRLLQNTLIAQGVPREIAQVVTGVVIVIALFLQRRSR